MFLNNFVLDMIPAVNKVLCTDALVCLVIGISGLPQLFMLTLVLHIFLQTASKVVFLNEVVSVRIIFAPKSFSFIELFLAVGFIAVEAVNLVTRQNEIVPWFADLFQPEDYRPAQGLIVVSMLLAICLFLGFFNFIESDDIETDPALEEIVRLDALVTHVSSIDCVPVLMAP